MEFYCFILQLCNKKCQITELLDCKLTSWVLFYKMLFYIFFYSAPIDRIYSFLHVFFFTVNGLFVSQCTVYKDMHVTGALNIIANCFSILHACYSKKNKLYFKRPWGVI